MGNRQVCCLHKERKDDDLFDPSMERRNRKQYTKGKKGDGDDITDYDWCTEVGSDIEEEGGRQSKYPGDYKAFQSQAAFSDDE